MNIRLDISETNWADPLPLLSLGALMFSYSDKYKVVIDLGDMSRDDHLIFLKFLATQGFIDTYSQFALFRWNRQELNQNNSKALSAELAKIQIPIHFRNADCIYAKLINVGELQFDQEHTSLFQIVEDMIGEAIDRLIDIAYGRDSLIRDRLLQKMRKIIFEVLCNAIEHAYPSDSHQPAVKHYAGIYARMRAGMPNTQEEVRAWRDLQKNERRTDCCPTIKSFEPNPLLPWLEIFICDAGIGLLSDITNWSVPSYLPNVKRTLRQLQNDIAKGKNRDKLRALEHILFTQPFSRFEDRSGYRTSVTGLLYLGLMLQQDNDFTRIYTGGEWVGNRHPWNIGLPTEGYLNVIKNANVTVNKCAPGTWYSFAIQPDQAGLDYPVDSWLLPTQTERDQLIDTLAEPPLLSIPDYIRFEDRKDDPHCSLPSGWIEFEKLRTIKDVEDVLILRPPRSFQKKQFGTWLERLAILSESNGVSHGVKCFILVDLSPFQAIAYSELLLHSRLSPRSEIDIILVTENWAVSCVRKTPTDVYRASVIDMERTRQFISEGISFGNNYSISVVDILRYLRLIDSKIFWKHNETTNHLPSDMFVSNKVIWPSSREIMFPSNHKEQYFINGYLDLPRALIDIERYQACLRALRRCMNLFPGLDIVPSDDLVRSIVLDADKKRYRLSSGISDAATEGKLIVGSIRVTSSTVNRILKRADIPESSRVLYIFNHPDSLLSKNERYLCILDWIPPVTTERHSDEIVYERIPETPYIGIGGEQAIILPRFKWPQAGADSLSDSLYVRNPEQTYDDFHKLGILKMGHWVYGSSHDLLTVNIGRALELADLEKGHLYKWMEITIEELCYKRGEDGEQLLPNAILVYPSHAVTDQIIAILENSKRRIEQRHSSQIRDDIQFPEGNVIPLKFLSSKTISPLQISPLSHDRLEKAINSLNEHRLTSRVVILDDGTLSGKVMGELKQLALCLNASDVVTVAIIDRSGLPIYVDYVERYLDKNRRYWRWDVPPLGHKRGCPLCAALNQISALRKQLHSCAISRRIEDWLRIWKPVEVVDHWENHGLKLTPLGRNADCDKQRFGIYPNTPNPSTHVVHHKTSTGMVSGIMEITRATTRQFYAIDKAIVMSSVYGPGIALEILSAEILLFIDELSYWDKVDIFASLLTYLWQNTEDEDVTALAGLCITLIDDDILLELWPKYKHECIQVSQVQTVDAWIVTDYLRKRYNGLPIGAQDECSDQPTSEERYNYSLMFSDGTFRYNISRIFDIIGVSHRAIHNMGLSACLGEIATASTANDLQLVVRRFKEAKRIIYSLIEALQAIDYQFTDQYGDYLPYPVRDIKIIEMLLNEEPYLSPNNSDETIKAIAGWANKVRVRIIDENSQESFANRYRNYFVYIPSSNLAVNAFLNSITTKLTSNEWKKIVSNRRETRKTFDERWISDEALPIIEGANTSKWPEAEIQIYFDRYVKHCIYEVLLNCLHVNEDVQNPWLPPITNSTGTAIKATMWWRLNIVNSYIEIEFVNSCFKDHIVLNPTEALSGLERVGGEVRCYVVEKMMNTVIPSNNEDSPSDEYLREYIGLQNGERVAITIVRVPLMKAISGR